MRKSKKFVINRKVIDIFYYILENIMGRVENN